MPTRIMSGNELIIQGAKEAGFALYTGYPGSPLADYFNILNAQKKELHDKNIRVVIGNSEANAAAMASGAKQAGRDVLVAMKSMGLHVASDALSVGNFANPGPVKEDEKGRIHPGVVIVVGDDPWSISTSTPADSRYLFKHLHIPFFEPATPQELKDWMKLALEVSKRSSVYCGVLLTTFMAEGGGRVQTGEEKAVSGSHVQIDPRTFDLQKNVMVPPNSLVADKAMIEERFPRVLEIVADITADLTFGASSAKVGLLSSGAIFESLKQVLEDSDHLDHVGLYKAATTYPLNEKQLLPWLEGFDHLVVVEEKRGFFESQLIELLQRKGLSKHVHGKKFPESSGFPEHGGLNYEIIRDKLAEFYSQLQVGAFKAPHFDLIQWKESYPRRLPTFCPGCPHRETLSLLKELRGDLEKKGVHLLSHGDVGCYSLSFLEPFKEMHNLSAMGQGGALGSGMDMFSTNPSVVLMGDSTFFHSGMTDISNSVQMGHDITYILLDNDNTAMTGHQMTPSSEVNVEGDARPKQKMVQVARSLGVDFAVEVNPSDRYFYKNLLAEIIVKKGTKVIVSNKECALTFHGRKKAQERKFLASNGKLESKTFFQINTEACEDCRACVEMTGCPGLTRTEDAYGSKVAIDPQICVSDSYCTKIKACPSFEEVVVENYSPVQIRLMSESVQLKDPIWRRSLDQIASGKDWRAVVTGVGGSGVTTISRIIAEASLDMGGRNDLDFKFMDQKGLAQRNGRVTGHCAIHAAGRSSGTVTPLGQADLLCSPDLLDASYSLSFLAPEGLAVIDSDYQVPVSVLLDRNESGDAFEPRQLREKFNEELGERLFMAPFKRFSAALLGKSVYASSMILGSAFQLGALPFSKEDMKKALESGIKKSERENNLRIFDLGRELALLGTEEFARKYDLDLDGATNEFYSEDYEQDLGDAYFFGGSWAVKNYRRTLEKALVMAPSVRPHHMARFVYDLCLYDFRTQPQKFLSSLEKLAGLYEDDLPLATRVLAKSLFIKDEVFVAHTMISSLKLRRDEKNYRTLGSSYKVSHINRPHFDVLGFKLEWDMNPSRWMFKVMRVARFLRPILPKWHSRERQLAGMVREKLLSRKLSKTELVALDNIKGYREVRYEAAAIAGLDAGGRS